MHGGCEFLRGPSLLFFPFGASILLTQILGERYSDFRLIRGAPFGAFCVAGVGDFNHASILLTQILGARYSDFGLIRGAPFGAFLGMSTMDRRSERSETTTYGQERERERKKKE